MGRVAHRGTKRGKITTFWTWAVCQHGELAGLSWGTSLDIYSQESVTLARGSSLRVCVCVWVCKHQASTSSTQRCFLHHLLFFFDHFFAHSAQFLILKRYFLTAFLAEGRLWLLSVFSGFLSTRVSVGVLLSNQILMETPSFMPCLCLCVRDIQQEASLPSNYSLYYHGMISSGCSFSPIHGCRGSADWIQLSVVQATLTGLHFSCTYGMLWKRQNEAGGDFSGLFSTMILLHWMN